MNTLHRLRRAAWGIRQELIWGWNHLVEGRWRYLVDVFNYRILSVWPSMPAGVRVRKLSTDTGVTLFYRRDRGDLQGIREIFIDEIYRLPNGAHPDSLVDLGANIGIATIWLCRTYDIEQFVAVEPVPENASLLKSNCEANSLHGEVVTAAVGARTGHTSFDVSGTTNMGRSGLGEVVVDVIGIDELMSKLPFPGSLLKMDIEGSEEALLTETDPSWITAFDEVVMEMHPEYCDIEILIRTITENGFTYFEPIEVSVGATRAKRERLFVRSALGLTR